MKKALIALILAVIFVLTFTLCVSAEDVNENESTDTEGDIILGDVNGDGVVTNADVLVIFRYIYNPELYPLPTLCNHDFSNWKLEKEATCTEMGEIVRTCSKCSKIEREILEGGHDYEETIVPPTKTDKGYTEHVCKNCGNSYIDTYVPAIGSAGLEFTSNSDGTCYVSGIGTCTDTDVVIPSASPKGDSVTSIGSSAFYKCTSLTSVTIGNSVTSIGAWAFEYCTALTSIEIPDSVTSIGWSAFEGCTSLTSVTIGDSVTSIGGSAFSNCSSLESITVQEGNAKYHSEGNCLIETESGTLMVGLKNSIIPSDGSVTSIGNYAFDGCTSLTSVTIPNSVTSIGNYAFFGCTSLTSIEIPDSVTSIGDSAFYGCTSLTSIDIPDSVTSIGYYAFEYCTSLKDVYYTGTQEQWKQITIDSYNDKLTSATIHYNHVAA